MPYNPDELLKLKHLTEFARQFRIKLDGETDPKSSNNITALTIARTSFNVVNGVCSASIPLSSLSARNSFAIVVGGIFNSYLTALPIWSSDSSTLRNGSWAGSGVGTGNNNRLTCEIYPNSGRVAQIITGNLIIPESPSYYATSIDFTINITEE